MTADFSNGDGDTPAHTRDAINKRLDTHSARLRTSEGSVQTLTETVQSLTELVLKVYGGQEALFVRMVGEKANGQVVAAANGGELGKIRRMIAWRPSPWLEWAKVLVGAALFGVGVVIAVAVVKIAAGQG